MSAPREVLRRVLRQAVVVAVFASAVAVATAAHGQDEAQASETDARLELLEEREPTIEEVRAAAVRAAGLEPRKGKRWARRARLSGLLPRLTVRATRQMARDQGLTLDLTETSDRLKLSTGDQLVVEARATWDLGKLVFDPVELRASRESARLWSERADLEAEVTRLFYERRRAQIEWILAPPEDAADAALRRLEIDELTAQLDALSGGFLKSELGE